MTQRSPHARDLARLLGIFHNVTYYAPEMKAFAEVGLPEYWRAYMAYRSAPMGDVPAPVVTSTFYNFAPAVVEAAIPSAWETTTPADAMALRDRCIDAALIRVFGEDSDSAVAEAASIALDGIAGADGGARPLYAAHAELPVPEAPLMRLWHAATLWREHRGDSHNVALAAAALDGLECHVLLAAKGVGSKKIITKIRGWTPTEWDAAAHRLTDRGLVSADGDFTDRGKQLRRDVEAMTDDLTAGPRNQLGDQQAQRLIALLEPLVQQLVDSGAVAASWPPPKPPA